MTKAAISKFLAAGLVLTLTVNSAWSVTENTTCNVTKTLDSGAETTFELKYRLDFDIPEFSEWSDFGNGYYKSNSGEFSGDNDRINFFNDDNQYIDRHSGRIYLKNDSENSTIRGTCDPLP